MEYKLTVWQNVDLLEDGDFTVTAIEYEPDEDGSFDSCTLYGFWTPLNGNEVPATMDINLDEPVLEPEDALERGWAIVMIAPDALTLQVVRRELSPTAGQLAYDDAPFVLEVLLEDGWQAIWGLDEMCSVEDALRQLPREVLADLL